MIPNCRNYANSIEDMEGKMINITHAYGRTLTRMRTAGGISRNGVQEQVTMLLEEMLSVLEETTDLEFNRAVLGRIVTGTGSVLAVEETTPEGTIMHDSSEEVNRF